MCSRVEARGEDLQPGGGSIAVVFQTSSTFKNILPHWDSLEVSLWIAAGFISFISVL